MRKSLAEIAKAIGGRVVGDGTLIITGVSGIKEAKSGDLTFLANPKYLPMASTTMASAIVVGKDVTVEGKSVVQTDNPSLAFAQIVGMLKEDLTPKVKGIHPTAIIAKDAKIGERVGIGPHVVVESGASIGDDSIICANVFIGEKTSLGKKCLIYPNVTIREEITVGNNVIIHSGTVVGADGFGYAQMGDIHVKIPQTGVVIIEDDVELGANVCVDRARFDKTVVGKGTKVDNLVQIAHNVQIGENCLVIAQCGIAGSTTVGRSVILAGQSAVTGHIHIGDRTVVTAQAGVTKSLAGGMFVSGSPAADHREVMKIDAHKNRLPEYAKTIKDLKARVEALEEKLRTKE